MRRWIEALKMMMTPEKGHVTGEAPPDCTLCPRLVALRAENARLEPDWHNGPVASFGDQQARLLIVGLAPGRGGANRTGRPFTGDYAGDLLYASLSKLGLSRGTYKAHPEDGVSLHGVMISNAVRCLPPENKPTGIEITTCRPFLVQRINALPKVKALFALGKIAHDSTVRALGGRLAAMPFGHETHYQLEGPAGPLALVSSYHCSRYNTQTGRLTEAMFISALGKAKQAAGL